MVNIYIYIYYIFFQYSCVIIFHKDGLDEISFLNNVCFIYSIKFLTESYTFFVFSDYLIMHKKKCCRYFIQLINDHMQRKKDE